MSNPVVIMNIMEYSRRLIEKHKGRMYPCADCFQITVTADEVALWNGQGKLFAAVSPIPSYIACSIPLEDFLTHIQSTLNRIKEESCSTTLSSSLL